MSHYSFFNSIIRKLTQMSNHSEIGVKVGMGLTILFSFLFPYGLHSQAVFEPPQNAVYAFLDEMAAEEFISLNSFAKPYARNFISAKLDTINQYRADLNWRQLSELDFYLKDYGKESHIGKDWNRRRDLFYYSDSTFNLTVNPIIGGSIMMNENGNRIHTRVGASFFASAGKFGFYGSLRDNAVTEVLAAPQYLTTREGQNYKHISSDNRSDYNEFIGGISYQWKWGDISVLKDRFIWGNENNGANIFSGKAPSYAAISYRLYPTKWLDFQYIHGWLVSEELDSARTYLTPHGNRKVFMNKNMAANYLTIKSGFKVDFTFGNSIVYSDNGIQPVFLIPFMFFKSADHTYNGTGSNELGQNAQMFFDISARPVKKVHVFVSLFIDEVSMGNMWDSEKHTNIMSLKVGGTWYNALPNLHLTAEYTRTNPWTYRHQIQSTTFESNGYNLGHYLGENADEIFFKARFKPWKTLSAEASIWSSRKGAQHDYKIIHGNANVTGLPFLETVDWNQLGMQLSLNWEIINDAVIFTKFTYLNSEGGAHYVPEYLSGEIITAEMGFRIGW